MRRCARSPVHPGVPGPRRSSLYAVFVISPFVQAFHYSLTDWTGISPEFEYVGLQNFERLLDDSLFHTALKNNALILVVVPIGHDPAGALLRVPAQRGRRVAGRGGQGHAGQRLLQAGVLPAPGAVGPGDRRDLGGDHGSDARRARSTRCSGWFGLGPPSAGCRSQPRPVVRACGCWSGGASGSTWCCSTRPCPRSRATSSRLRCMDGAGRYATFVRVTLPLLWDTDPDVVGLPRHPGAGRLRAGRGDDRRARVVPTTPPR